MDILNFFIISLVMIISSQYNYDFFSVLIVIIYSLFCPSLSNLIFVLLLLLLVFIKTGEIAGYWWCLAGVLVFIIVVATKFGSKKKGEDTDAGSYDDLLKMLGGH